MDKPKVGEVWISSTGCEHTILCCSDSFIITIFRKCEFVFLKYNMINIGNGPSFSLKKKKPTVITRYLGYFTDEDSIDGYVTKLSFVETPSYKQKIEIEIGN